MDDDDLPDPDRALLGLTRAELADRLGPPTETRADELWWHLPLGVGAHHAQRIRVIRLAADRSVEVRYEQRPIGCVLVPLDD